MHLGGPQHCGRPFHSRRSNVDGKVLCLPRWTACFATQRIEMAAIKCKQWLHRLSNSNLIKVRHIFPSPHRLFNTNWDGRSLDSHRSFCSVFFFFQPLLLLCTILFASNVNRLFLWVFCVCVSLFFLTNFLIKIVEVSKYNTNEQKVPVVRMTNDSKTIDHANKWGNKKKTNLEICIFFFLLLAWQNLSSILLLLTIANKSKTF